jgi:hypothetical protein
MPSSPEIEVTKLDAAQRQLRTAISLWFHDGDSVSIHTLLAASHEIIHRLYRNKGLENLVFDSDMIRDEHRADFSKNLKKAPSFFKHAKQDANDTLKFKPEMNDVLPMFLIQGLCDMGEDLGLEERSFIYWLKLFQPDFFVSKEQIPVEVVEKLIGVDKKEFFDACQYLWGQGRLHNLLGPRPVELKGR